ncbi:hypothetical protein IAT38_003201 [Cryptococcus sp. DSM 104549]
MVYAPQRRHAVASLTSTAQALGLIQHFYTPNILILLARLLAHLQIHITSIIQPTRSLLIRTLMLIAMNLAACGLHVLDFAGGMNGGKGLVLDFVGQENPASLTRVLLLDLALFLVQLLALCLSYANTTAVSYSSVFPYPDILLPPDEEEPVEEGERDIESGRRKWKGKGPAYEVLENDDGELWLDDDDALQGSPPAHTTLRPQNPPLIFSLPFKHLLRIIIFLPAPAPPPRAFSGGTPQVTPPGTPVETSVSAASGGLGAAGRRGSEESEEEEEGQERIPGAYRAGGGG